MTFSGLMAGLDLLDKNSINGDHAPHEPHVQFAVKDNKTGQYISNNHIRYKD